MKPNPRISRFIERWMGRICYTIADHLNPILVSTINYAVATALKQQERKLPVFFTIMGAGESAETKYTCASQIAWLYPGQAKRVVCVPWVTMQGCVITIDEPFLMRQLIIGRDVVVASEETTVSAIASHITILPTMHIQALLIYPDKDGNYKEID